MTEMDYQGMVKEFMVTAGQDVAQFKRELTTKEAEFRYKLFQEELEEFKKATEKNDRVEQLDGLCDMHYILLGTALTYGHNISKEVSFFEEKAEQDESLPSLEELIRVLDALGVDEFVEATAAVFMLAKKLGFLKNKEYYRMAFQAVHESNMTKFCTSETQAWDTELVCSDQGVDTYLQQVGKYIVVKRAVDGKVMKSIGYAPVNLKEIISVFDEN